MRVNTSRHVVKYLAIDARMKGSPVSLWLGEGATRCTRPVELQMFGYPDKLLTAERIERDAAVCHTAYGRCRRCEACLRHRARLWTARAIDETRVSVRTWFGTLTLRPDWQTHARYSALSILERRQAEVDEDSVFQKSVEVIAPEITRFLKRVRKVAPFRYMLVTEKHQSGLPHFHMLIHEYQGAISKRVLDDRWRYGFSQWRLVPPGDERRCGYVAKYLAKSALTRVRASAGYGSRGASTTLTERLVEATRATVGTIGNPRLFGGCTLEDQNGIVVPREGSEPQDKQEC